MDNKTGRYPFKFFVKLTLPKLTGIYALNLKELLKGIQASDENILYYHTHHFLLQFHNVSPAAPNDFAYWITNVLGEELLGEEISSIDLYSFETMDKFKTELIIRIENFISKNKNTRQVEPQSRFNFTKAITFIMDTKKYAYSLSDFLDILKNITVYSLYYHFFEASFRLKSRKNDFSMWIDNELNLPELAKKITNLDPYTHTMNELKNSIIKIIEQYLKS